VVPVDTPPGTILTNMVKISSDSPDANLDDHTRMVTVTVPLLPPVITYPIPGTTCDGMVTITGRAYPGATVEIFINGWASGTTTADPKGDWAYDGYFTDGENSLYVVASFKGTDEELQAATSTTIPVTVDHSLSWSPMSLRFTAENGRVLIPRGPDGRADAKDWKLFLRPGQTYTVSVTLCCGGEEAGVVLTLTNGEEITLTDPDKDGTYTATFSTQTDKPVGGSLKLCVTCFQIQTCSDGTVLIDPEGVIFDLVTGKAIGGSSAACFQAQPSAAAAQPIFSLWPGADFGQINPQTTGDDGYFSFFTPAGTFRVEASAGDYQPYRTEDLVVVDAPVERNIPLTPQLSGPADHVISIGANGFSPAFLAVEPGAVIEWVNVDSGEHTSVSITPTVSYPASAAPRSTVDLSGADAWDSGILASGESYLRQLTTPGTYTYTDATVSIHQATIVVNQPQAAEWTIFLPLIVR
jgi:plastocyanin